MDAENPTGARVDPGAVPAERGPSGTGHDTAGRRDSDLLAAPISTRSGEPLFPAVTEAAPARADVSQLRATLKELRDLHDEAAAVIAHFADRPAITAEDCTEDDARWIMRYDAVCEAYRSHGYVV